MIFASDSGCESSVVAHQRGRTIILYPRHQANSVASAFHLSELQAHPVSTGSLPGDTPQKEPSSPQPFHFGLRRWESAFLSIRTVRSEV
jgi:hypothetical protein